MKYLSVSVELTGKELEKMAVRYHFDEEKVPHIQTLHEAVLPLIQAEVCFCLVEEIKESEKRTGFEEEDVLCVATLGEGIDRLQDLYSQAEAVEEAYMLDCIGSALLEKVYESLKEEIFRETGLWLTDYAFPGAQLPIEKTAEILMQFQGEKTEGTLMQFQGEKTEEILMQFQGEKTEGTLMQFQDEKAIGISVSCSSVYSLTPKKSVVFAGKLGEMKTNCTICSNCPKVDCPNRSSESTKNACVDRSSEWSEFNCRSRSSEDLEAGSEKELQESIRANYSYGYQRIFGKGE